MDYILHLLIIISFYTMLSQSLNLSAGFTGLISLSQASFYGIGAYTTAILSTKFGYSFWFNLPIAIAVGVSIALLISIIAVRTVEDYFVICTLGTQVIFSSIINNTEYLTNGPFGISNIPPLTFFSAPVISKILFFILSASFVCILWYILTNIAKAGFGKILTSISEDEIFTMSIGKDIKMYKIVSFTTSSALAVIPGALYAHYMTYISPLNFNVAESTFILSIVIIGGFRNFWGCFAASAFLVLFPECLRFLGLPSFIAANLRQIFYGLVLIAIMVFNKNGLYEFFRPRSLKTK